MSWKQFIQLFPLLCFKCFLWQKQGCFMFVTNTVCFSIEPNDEKEPKDRNSCHVCLCTTLYTNNFSCCCLCCRKNRRCGTYDMLSFFRFALSSTFTSIIWILRYKMKEKIQTFEWRDKTQEHMHADTHVRIFIYNKFWTSSDHR